MISFEKAFDRIVGHEGGFQNQHLDRGNWTSGKVGTGELKGTKFGISAMSYPHLDIKNITREDVKPIYYKDFWLPLGGDSLDPALVFQAFDASFHHGISNCIQMVQRALRVIDDGHFGPKSLQALKEMDTSDLIMRFLAQRLRFMTNTKVWDLYSRGWTRRICDNLEYASEDTVE